MSGARQFWEILQFELRFRRRQIPTYVFAVIFAVLAFFAVSTDVVRVGGASGPVANNSSMVIITMMTILNLFGGLLVATAFIASSVNRDEEWGIQSLFFATPLRKAPYLTGRFLGALIITFLVMGFVPLGMVIGTAMPWIDAEKILPFTARPYLWGMAVLVLPTLIVAGSITFAVATFTRRTFYAYVALITMLVGYTVSRRWLGDLDSEMFVALSDPFGLASFRLATRYWTVAEQNSALPNLSDGYLGLNRMLWTGIGLSILAGTVATYRMETRLGGRRRKILKDEPAAIGVPTELPRPARMFGAGARLNQFSMQTRMEVRGLLSTVGYKVIALIGAAMVLGTTAGLVGAGGTTTYPVTHLMLTSIEGGMGLFLLIVIVFYSGELIQRERKLKAGELFDSLPIPNWIPMVSKFVALVVGAAIVLGVGMVTTIGFQLVRGYTHLELGHYLFDVIVLQWPGWVIVAALAFLAQVTTNNKYLGYLVVIVITPISTIALPQLDLEHSLYAFPPFGGLQYSDMNGYGHFLWPRLWFSLYWGAFAGLMLVLTEIAWVRGTDNGLKVRFQEMKRRLSASRIAALGLMGAAFVGSGGFIYYNTNVLNEYRPSPVREALQARYEREYKQYENLPHPRITKVKVEVELYPETRAMTGRGTIQLVNKTSQSIEELHVILGGPDLEVDELEIPEATLRSHDEDIGYRIYDLARPLAPKDEMTVTFTTHVENRGFVNSGSDTGIVFNGSFINNGRFMPTFGYAKGGELQNPDTRKEQGLPERERMAKIDDQSAWGNTYISHEADWVEFEATVSTTPSQIAIAPGYLEREWEEGGRRYFHYAMDAPILNFYSFLSADYAVVKDEWVPKEENSDHTPVAIEIYHHAEHTYNVEKMIESIKVSLDYFTVNFSPYQHRQVRILEFPRYANFAQSFPNTIPYSEGIGFIADAKRQEDIDYVFYVTAHEVAHQWWAHQVIGADVQGSTLMSETLAQYSALMVMEEQYGPDKMPKFLAYELDRYLNGRGFERIEEQPLLLVENQQYIHYRKGSVVMYALKEYIGEEALNQALSDYIAEVAFQEPPYTTSRDLYDHLQKATPPELQYLLEDMFEKITLYDNRALAATYEETEDGKFAVSLKYKTRKVYGDGKGNETEAEDMNDFIEIGVYAEAKDEDGKELEPGRPLYLERHQLEPGEDTIEIVVDQQPVRAGIDPRHLLIDRNRRDNLKTLSAP